MFKEVLSHVLAAALVVGSVVACAPKYTPPQGTAQSEGEVLKNDRLVCHIDGAVTYQADAEHIYSDHRSTKFSFYPEQMFYYPRGGETCRILQAQ